jgi:hypothetical protein
MTTPSSQEYSSWIFSSESGQRRIHFKHPRESVDPIGYGSEIFGKE